LTASKLTSLRANVWPAKDHLAQLMIDQELEAVRNGTAQVTPAEEAIPDWPERLAAARAEDR
jgi:hypothetical protein